MDFFQNPFYILSATPHDNHRRIMELADRYSLIQDPEKCREAAATLTHPRRRLYAEIAWLPSIAPESVEEILEFLRSSALNLFGIDLTQVRNLCDKNEQMPITKSNLLTAGLSRLVHHTSENVPEWILEIAWASKDIDAEAVCAVINSDRKVAGFSPVQLSNTEEEIQNLQDYYRQVMTSALKRLSAKQRARAVTLAVELTTRRTKQLPRLINRLVASYEIDAHESLAEHEAMIAELNDKLRAAVDADRPDSELAPVVAQFIQAVKDWDAVAQPIQVSRKSQGRSHDASADLAWRVRELALHLWNEYGKLDICQQLINTLQEVFAEVNEVVAIIDEDTRTLGEIAQQHTRLTQGVKLFERLKEQVDSLQTAADSKKLASVLKLMAIGLIQSVKKWDAAAQPIEASQSVSLLVRGLALHLWNEHGKLDLSLQLTDVLQEVFGEVDDIANRLAEDKRILNQFAKQRARMIEGVEKFEKIKDQVEKLRAAADAKRFDALTNSMTDELIQSVNNWDVSTQPIEANQSVSLLVRDLALHLWNEHGQLDLSLQLTKVLQRVFADVGEISDRLAEDKKVLSQLAQQRARMIEKSVNENRAGGYGCLIFLLLGILGALLQAC